MTKQWRQAGTESSPGLPARLLIRHFRSNYLVDFRCFCQVADQGWHASMHKALFLDPANQVFRTMQVQFGHDSLSVRMHGCGSDSHSRRDRTIVETLSEVREKLELTRGEYLEECIGPLREGPGGFSVFIREVRASPGYGRHRAVKLPGGLGGLPDNAVQGRTAHLKEGGFVLVGGESQQFRRLRDAGQFLHRHESVRVRQSQLEDHDSRPEALAHFGSGLSIAGGTHVADVSPASDEAAN